MLRTWPAAPLTLLAAVGAALTSSALSAQDDKLRALDGEWIFVEDRTEGRTLEQLQPPMSSKFSMRVEDGAVVLNGHGSGHRDVRIKLDGTATDVPGTPAGAFARYRASWKDGVLTTEVEFARAAGQAPEGLIKREFRITKDGLMVRSNLMLTAGVWSVGLYRQAKDIPLPVPARAAIGDLAWVAGAWIGKRSSGSSIEERWTQPSGGAMLAVSRTVNTSGRMSAFEFLRIVEREGGLVYIAQPGGRSPTEFVLTEVSKTRAVFENPRHDFPRRIVYELTAEGRLTASIGQLKGGTPVRFEFKREGT